MAVPCRRTEPVITQHPDGFELRKLNKKIICTKTDTNKLEVIFARILNEEEQEGLKDLEPHPKCFVLRKKLFVNKMYLSKETTKDLAYLLLHISEDYNAIKYRNPEEETKPVENE